MESEFVKGALPAGVYVSAERAAEILRVDTARVSKLGHQGRLVALEEPPGAERRYGYESVLGMRAEDLMRGLAEKAREKCPELEEQIENLAVVQFGRGQLAGQNELGAKVERAVEEMGRGARAIQDPA